MDFFSDACAIEDNIEDDIPDWREWAPVATDGELGAFIELVSEGKVYTSSMHILNSLYNNLN